MLCLWEVPTGSEGCGQGEDLLKITSVFLSCSELTMNACSGRRNGTWTCAVAGDGCIQILHRPDEKLNREVVSAL